MSYEDLKAELELLRKENAALRKEFAGATNIPAITPQGRRVAQAALELCVSLERRDFVTFRSSMSLNAELVACRTSTP